VENSVFYTIYEKNIENMIILAFTTGLLVELSLSSGGNAPV